MTADALPSPVLKKTAPLYKSLFVQVLVALLLGIVLGMASPDFAIGLKVLSDGFLKLISMIVAPIVFCVVVHGIAGAGDLKKVGRVGVKALVYFEAMTTIALALGIVLAFALQFLGVVGVVAECIGIEMGGIDIHAVAGTKEIDRKSVV